MKEIPGDHFFIRANFSRTAEQEGELSFTKDDILLIKDTLYRGQQGLWLAWVIDDNGAELRYGTIPSKFM